MTEDAEVVLIGLGTVAMPGAHGGATLARARPQSRLREPALVPPVPHRGAARLPEPLQGRRRHRPRLRPWLAGQLGHPDARDPLLSLPGQESAGGG